MSNTSSSVRIVAISWFSALVMNTLFGTALMTSFFTDAEMVGEYALLGFVFAILFTSPLAAILFMCLRIFVRMEIVGRQLFICYFLAGMLLTAATFVIFSFTVFASFLPIWSLFLVAATSGSLGMLVEYRAVVQLSKQDDRSTIQNFLND